MRAKLVGWLRLPSTAKLEKFEEGEFRQGKEDHTRKHVENQDCYALEVLENEDGSYMVVAKGEPTKHYPDFETCCVALELRGYITKELRNVADHDN